MFNVFIIFNYYYVYPRLDSLPDNDYSNLQNTDPTLFWQIVTFHLACLILMTAYVRASFTPPGGIPPFYKTKQLQEHELDRLLDSTFEFLSQFHTTNHAVLSGLNPS